MGTVFSAVAEAADGAAGGPPIGTRVAVKTLHPHLVEKDELRRRFLREARIGLAVLHENVVRTYEVGEDDGTLFLAMEFVEGQTLTELRREMGTAPEQLCRHVASELCKALGALHEAGVVHRDVKPDNVLVTPNHVVKLVDFGVARSDEQSAALSREGAFVGSVNYAAPEQFGGTDVDGRCDLHALGVVLYELSCGEHPYRGGGLPEVIRRIRREPPERLGDLNPQLTPYFENVVHTLLAKVPDARFQTAGALLDVLQGGEDGSWWQARRRGLRGATAVPLRRVRIPRETAVYGREDELESLRDAFDSAAGGGGRVLLVEGEAGVGKSRLVDELVVRLQRRGTLLRFLHGAYPPGGIAAATEGLVAAFRDEAGDTDIARHLAGSPELQSAFAALLRGEPVPEGTPALGSDAVGTCFARVLAGMSEELPTVLLVDDLHSAGDDALAMFASLAHAVRNRRVLLIGTLRPSDCAEWAGNLCALEHAERLTLTRLRRAALLDVLAETFGSRPLAERMAPPIEQRSDGNPFFVFEIVRVLRERGFTTAAGEDSGDQTRLLDGLELPDSVRELLRARLARLTDDERELLDVAACDGHEFDPLLVGDAIGAPRLAVLRTLGRIERRHRLIRSVGERFVFDHHQLQQAVYDALSEPLRRELHSALADALESRCPTADPGATNDVETAPPPAVSAHLCRHLVRGGRAGDALRVLGPALDHHEGRQEHARVVALAESVLDAPGVLAGSERARLLGRVGALSLDRLGRREQQVSCLCEAARLCDEAGDVAAAVTHRQALAVALTRTNRFDEAEEIAREAMVAAEAAGEDETAASARSSLAHVLYARGRLDEAGELLHVQLEATRQGGARLAEANALSLLGAVAYSRGRLHDAIPFYEQSRAICRELGHVEGEAAATGNLGLVKQHTGDLDGACADVQRQLELSRQMGHRLAEAQAALNLGSVLANLERLDEVQPHYELARGLFREVGNPSGETLYALRCGALLAQRGRSEEALGRYDVALGHARAAGDRRYEIAILRGRAHRLFECGRHDEALAALAECLASCDEVGDRRTVSAALLTRAWVERETEGDDAARSSFEAALEAATEVGNAEVRTVALAELARLDAARVPEALAAYEEDGVRLIPPQRRAVEHLLWKATGERRWLERAYRSAKAMLTRLSPADRVAVRRSVPAVREIVDAWSAETPPQDPSDTEAPTRIE